MRAGPASAAPPTTTGSAAWSKSWSATSDLFPTLPAGASTECGRAKRRTRTAGRFILDRGGLLALSDGNSVARAAFERAHRDGFVLVVPTPVLAEIAGVGERLDLIVGVVDALLPTSPAIARVASDLLRQTRLHDAVVAIVTAEALASLPAVVLTDRGWDVRRLLEGQPDAQQVTIIDI
jgi:hypothetical protein